MQRQEENSGKYVGYLSTCGRGGRTMHRFNYNGVSDRANYLIKQAQEKAMAGDHQTAIEYLKSVISLDPRHAGALAMLGDCTDCLGEHEQAIAYYDQALRIDPYHADAWFNKGMSLKSVGRHTEATDCIGKSIELYCGH
jgi:tetratricopeptide (TPR) repeat protein